MNGRGMVLHAGRRIVRPGVTRTTTLCGRMNARSRDGMNIADTGEAVTCKFCLAKLRESVPAAASAVPAAPVVARPIARPTALELLHAVCRRHGWRRAEGESMVTRVQALYTVTAEPGRNRYVATPKALATAAAALVVSPTPSQEPSDDH